MIVTIEKHFKKNQSLHYLDSNAQIKTKDCTRLVKLSCKSYRYVKKNF